MPDAPKEAQLPEDLTAQEGEGEAAKPLEGEKGKYDLRSKTADKGSAEGDDEDDEDEESKEEAEPDEAHWIVIKLQDDKGNAVGVLPSGAGVVFHLKVGKKLYKGSLDDLGKARVDGLPPEAVEVSFPGIDASELTGP